MTLFHLPWIGRRRVAAETDVLIFTTRFDTHNPLSGLMLLLFGIALWLAAASSAGCVGASLRAYPQRGRYYTMSAWRDEHELRVFGASKIHRAGIKAVHRVGRVNGVLTSWWEPGATWRPRWKAAIRRTAAASPGPYNDPAPRADR